MRFNSRSLALATFMLAVAVASADPVNGHASGTFVNPQPAGATVTGVGTNHFTYGDPDGFGTGPNSLTFAGNTTISSTTGAPFRVGSLTYFNGTTTSGTTPASVQLRINLVLTDPLILDQNFTYGLDLITTPNTGTPDENADYVRLTTLPGQGTFTYNGTLYTLNLTGFQNVVGDGFLASSSTELHVREGLTASADIFGTISQAPIVPGPAAALPFLGLALRRRRKAR